nr:MAG TPA: hypothetical protein [Caudoviricetes sp.]
MFIHFTSSFQLHFLPGRVQCCLCSLRPKYQNGCKKISL